MTTDDSQRPASSLPNEESQIVPSSLPNEESSRSQSTFLDSQILAQIKLLNTDAQKIAFAKAMYMSIKLDRTGNIPPRPRSPYLITAHCRFNTKQQKQLGIVIDKNGAIEFLNNFGLPITSKSSFNKRHSRLSYQELFQRLAPVTGGKNLVCTYAEWLHMESYGFEPQLPQDLIDLLPEGWTPPDPNLPEGNPAII